MMRVLQFFFIILTLSVSLSASAQSDTLVGVLRDTDQKAIKRYAVTLGRQSPLTVKTNNQGLFIIPEANLNDTLFMTHKKTKEVVEIPTEGYPYLIITLEENAFNVDRRQEADEELTALLERSKKKKSRFSVMKREDIEKSGCLDIECLLRRMSGVTFVNGSVRIRNSSSVNSPSDPLVVMDDIPMDVAVLSTIAVEDVSEIQVLKDASSYGVRGANGAIIIKTGQ